MSRHRFTRLAIGAVRLALATLLLSGLVLLPRPALGMFSRRDAEPQRKPEHSDYLSGLSVSTRGVVASFPNPGNPNAPALARGGDDGGGGRGGAGMLLEDVAPAAVSVAGAATGDALVTHVFTATVTPVTTTVPLTYTWQATGQSTVVHGGVSSLSDTAGFSWSTGGSKPITVTASNALGQAVGTHSITVAAPPAFTDMGALGLPAADVGALAWGDYDNDGDLDLFYSGYTGSARLSRIYRNDNGAFTDINAGLEGLHNSAAAWGDYDNDGDLDLALTGGQGGLYTACHLYRNNGDSTFTNVNIGMTNVSQGALAWGDYDNDGDLDLLETGVQLDSGSSRVTVLLRNNGNGSFTSVSHPFPAAYLADAAWGDYDNDNDLDLLISGRYGPFTRIYRNNNDSTFTDLNAGLTAVEVSSVAWGDYDNDGDLDAVIQGLSGSTKITRLYRNNGNSTFTDANAGLVGGSSAETRWGDYDNDGDLDLLVLSINGSRLYRNDAGSFVDIGLSLPSVENLATAAWGDYDGDGDLDFVLSGSNNSTATRYVRFYRNNAAAANSAPAAPTGLQASVQNGTVTLSWSAASDTQTPAAGLSYNLRVGTTAGAQNVLVPMANATTGYRRLPALGNAGEGTSAVLNLSTPGTYYWSVQAVDSAWQGGSWASEGSFTVGVAPAAVSVAGPLEGAVQVTHAFTATVSPALAGRPLTYTWEATGQTTVVHAGVSTLTDSAGFSWSVTGTKAITVTAGNALGQAVHTQSIIIAPLAPFTDMGALGLPAVDNGALAWGDYDNDGDLDLLYSGSTGSARVTRIYRNNGDGTFTDINAGLEALTDSAAAWGDYDGDGDLDIAIIGNNGSASPVQHLYRNNGNGTFTHVTSGMIGLSYGALAWGDYDNDGDLDLLQIGATTSSGLNRTTRLWRNDGGGTFTSISNPFPALSNCDMAWGDYDNDGDLDLLVSGSNGPLARIYRNNGNGTFTDLNAGLPSVGYSSVAWGDYDNDGDLDAVVQGVDSGSQKLTRLYRNNGNSTFTDANAGLAGGSAGEVRWGDYDNDGDLDLLVLSIGGSRVYRNDAGALVDLGLSLPGVEYATAAWGDYDGDGDLDFVFCGNSGSTRTVRFYRNNRGTANSAPATPTGLQASVQDGAQVTLSWNAASDAQTPAAGLTYNLRVGTTPGAQNTVPAMADASTGYRRLPALGNANHGTSAQLTLPVGTYYWSVQAVDTSLAGGAFATEGSFIVGHAPAQVSLAGPAVGLVGAAQPFTATVSPANTTLPLTYAWQGSGLDPVVHPGISSLTDSTAPTWSLPGPQVVTVTVSNPAGTVTATRAITLYNPAQAGFTAAPLAGVAPLTVTFTNTTTGDFATSLWSLGDGVTSTLTSPVHSYTAPGVYTVTLQAGNPAGSDVEVKPALITVYTPVQASFAMAPARGIAPVTVVFTNTSTGDWSTTLWDFGDAITSTLAGPTHTYTLPGVYTVTLTVSGSGGEDVEVRAQGVTVYEDLSDLGALQSDLWLMNAGSAPAAANVLYRREAGGALLRLDLGRRVPVRATHVVSATLLAAGVPGAWLGPGSVLTTQPLQVAVRLGWEYETGARTAAIYRQAAPGAAGFFPLLAAQAGRADRIVVHNPQPQAVAVTVRFYDRLGSQVLSQTTSIPAGAVQTLALAELQPDFSASAGYGSAYLTADAPVSALALLAWSDATEAYVPPAAGDTTLWAPGITRRQVSGETWDRSEVAVRNPGGGSANVQVAFLARDGSVTHTFTDTIPANGTAAYDTREPGTLDPARFQALTSALGANWEGTVRVVCSNGRALAGLSVSWLPGAPVTDSLSIPAIGDGATGGEPVAFPLVHRRVTGGTAEHYSRLLVQNTAGVSGTVTVEFYDAAGTRAGAAYQVAIQALGGVRLDVNDGLELPAAALQALGDGFSGSLVLTPSAGVRLAAVCQDLQPGEGRAAGYAGAPLP